MPHLRAQALLAHALALSPIPLGVIATVLPDAASGVLFSLALLLPIGGLVLAVATLSSSRGKLGWSWCVVPLVLPLLWLAFAGSACRLSDPPPVDVTRIVTADLTKAVELYAVKFGEYPERLEALVERRVLDRVWTDAWGQPYRYTLRSDGFSICSDGPDAQAATADDLCAERARRVRTATGGR